MNRNQDQPNRVPKQSSSLPRQDDDLHEAGSPESTRRERLHRDPAATSDDRGPGAERERRSFNGERERDDLGSEMEEGSNDDAEDAFDDSESNR